MALAPLYLFKVSIVNLFISFDNSCAFYPLAYIYAKASAIVSLALSAAYRDILLINSAFFLPFPYGVF